MSPNFAAKSLATKMAIVEKLKVRSESEYIPDWIAWFDGLPKNHSEAHSSYYNVLAHLVEHHSGPCKRTILAATGAIVTDSDYVDPITFKGGPVQKEERKELLESIDMYVPLVPTTEDKKAILVRALGM